jgi:glycine cleavage system H protein
MMKFPTDLKYTKNDEWIRVEGGIGTVGITDYAQDHLSDLVYLDYAVKPGQQVAQGAAFGNVESVKAAAEFYMPVDGEVTEVNAAAKEKPESVNSDAYGAWLAKIKITNASQVDALMDAGAYEAYCKERG